MKRTSGLSLAERMQLFTLLGPGCWLWQARLDRDGYGRIKVSGKHRGAHRVAYELANGPIPDGLHIDHLCRTPACVRPDHLEAVTPRVNTLRGVSVVAMNAVATHCNKGHAFDAENTYMWRGGRHCRACHKAAVRRHQKRKAS